LAVEALPASLVAFLRQSFTGELYNMYGPTETAIWSTVLPRARAAKTAFRLGNRLLIRKSMSWIPSFSSFLREESAIYLSEEMESSREYFNRPEIDGGAILSVIRFRQGSRLLPHWRFGAFFCLTEIWSSWAARTFK